MVSTFSKHFLHQITVNSNRTYLYMTNYTEPNNYSFIVKNTKSEKRTHFAVTKNGEAIYKEFLVSFWACGTKFCSKIVVICGASSAAADCGLTNCCV